MGNWSLDYGKASGFAGNLFDWTDFNYFFLPFFLFFSPPSLSCIHIASLHWGEGGKGGKGGIWRLCQRPFVTLRLYEYIHMSICIVHSLKSETPMKQPAKLVILKLTHRRMLLCAKYCQNGRGTCTLHYISTFLFFFFFRFSSPLLSPWPSYHVGLTTLAQRSDWKPSQNVVGKWRSLQWDYHGTKGTVHVM